MRKSSKKVLHGEGLSGSLGFLDALLVSGNARDAGFRNFRTRTVPIDVRPSALYNGMVYPVMSNLIKGVLWNQGEIDSKWPHLYKTLFPEMIRSWRENLGQGDFPFVYAQLSSNLEPYMRNKK